VGVPCCLIKATVGPNPRDRSGLVASLARPGGNVTGLSLTSPELAGKRLQLLREVVPRLRRLAILANVDYPPAMQELDEIETSAQKLGVETIALKIRKAADITPAFEALKGRAQEVTRGWLLLAEQLEWMDRQAEAPPEDA
jgi:ABC-type uncharacterized transport system substrate-binding protein